jgi:hypothetical protein
MAWGFKRKKDDPSNQPPATEKLKKSLVDSLASRVNNAAKLPIVQLNLDNDRREKKGWIRTLVPTSSFLNTASSKGERKSLRSVFKVALIPMSAFEHAFQVSLNATLSIANGQFELLLRARHVILPRLLRLTNALELAQLLQSEKVLNARWVKRKLRQNSKTKTQRTASRMRHLHATRQIVTTRSHNSSSANERVL